MIEFYSDKEIHQVTIEQALGDRFDGLTFYHPSAKGEFPFGYIIKIRADTLSLREKVNTLKSIATLAMANILLDDEDFDPYQWIHIAPTGAANTVALDSLALDDRDELIVEYFFNLAWGMIGVEKMLDSEEVDKVLQFLKDLSGFSLKYVEPGIIDPSFREAQLRIPALKIFHQYYLVTPPQMFPWHSAAEKSGLMIGHLTAVNKEMGNPLCYFPPNGTIVANIPGGSDSQKHCLLIAGGQVEKIVYKNRREKWV